MKTIGFMADTVKNDNESSAIPSSTPPSPPKKSNSVLNGFDIVMIGLIVIGIAVVVVCGMVAGMHYAINEFNENGIEHVTMTGPNGDEEYYFIKNGYAATPVADFGTNRIFRITKK